MIVDLRCKLYGHFLELVQTMRERFRVRVHAYCLMPNHYHLLVSTPDGNISQAFQWLNGSYGIWHNRKHNRSGHLYGERFKAILVEDRAWGLEVSVYIHMNPVATKAFGLGRRAKAAALRGRRPLRSGNAGSRLCGNTNGVHTGPTPDTVALRTGSIAKCC